MTIPRGYIPGKTDFPVITSASGTVSFDDDNIQTSGDITVYNQDETEGLQITSTDISPVGLNQDLMIDASLAGSGNLILKTGQHFILRNSTGADIFTMNGATKNAIFYGTLMTAGNLTAPKMDLSDSSPVIKTTSTNANLLIDTSQSGTGDLIHKSLGNHVFQDGSGTARLTLTSGGSLSGTGNWTASGILKSYSQIRSEGTFTVGGTTVIDSDCSLLNLADITSNRPVAPVVGQQYFDTTLAIPIWYDGTNWIDATGTTV